MLKKNLFLFCFIFTNAIFLKGSAIGSDALWSIICLPKSVSTEERIELIKKYLTNGGSIDAKNLKGQTALMSAASGNHLLFLEFCLAQGAKINAQDEDGYTALMCAAESKSSRSVVDVLKVLVAARANVNLQTYKHEKTALHCAVDTTGHRQLCCRFHKDYTRFDAVNFFVDLPTINLQVCINITDPNSTSLVFNHMTPREYAYAHGNTVAGNFLKKREEEKELFLQELTCYNTAE